VGDWPETASTDPVQIAAWWQQWPTANVGILTGARSRLAVLDTDPRNGGGIALDLLEARHGRLPETPQVLSGGADGGDHRYFALDGPLAKGNPATGLNLQADLAFVVAPPSLHASGNHYLWEASSGPDDVPLAPLPAWLKALTGASHVSAPAVPLPAVLPQADVHTLPVTSRTKFLIVTGQHPDDPHHFTSRSEALFSVLMSLVHAGVDDATIASVLLDPRYGISEKPRTQKNPKSPTYEAQTRAWVAGEIGRARAKAAHRADQEPQGPPESPEDPADLDDLLRRAADGPAPAHEPGAPPQHQGGTNGLDTATVAATPGDEQFCDALLDWVRAGGGGRGTPVVLDDAGVIARLCACEDALFLDTILRLAQPDTASLVLLFTDWVMTRLAALPYATYHGAFLPRAKHLPDFDVRHYRGELRPYLLRHSAQQGCRQVWAPTSAADLYAEDIPDLEFVVEDILPVGATLFVGRAKDGKSLACWNLLFAVATDGKVFGRYKVTPGPVLYLALEDGKRRAQQRLKAQMRAANMTEPPANFELQYWDAPRVGDGLEEKLHAWIDTHPGAKLIVVDILEKVRPLRTKGGSVYGDDYAAVTSLQRLAQERGIAVLIVHHVSKSKVEDFRTGPSGAESLLGGVDTLWSLKRIAGETSAMLQITGREVLEHADIPMQFKDGFWTAMFAADGVVLNPAHQAIITMLRSAGSPMTPTQLATELRVNLNTMKVHLMRLVERGLVAKVGEGQYTCLVVTPDRTQGATEWHERVVDPGSWLERETPETPESETQCNPVTQTSQVPEESPAATPDVRTEEEDPLPQDIPHIDTSPPADDTPEEPREDGLEAQAGIRVTRVTADATPAPRDELILRHAPTNGHMSGHAGGTGAAPCRHEVKTTEAMWDGSVLVTCSRCRQILDVQGQA
jgi:hypothetical protein